MKVLQEDSGVDGWWALVEDDSKTQHLLHVDGSGRDAPRPSKADWEARIPLPFSLKIEVEAEDGRII